MSPCRCRKGPGLANRRPVPAESFTVTYPDGRTATFLTKLEAEASLARRGGTLVKN